MGLDFIKVLFTYGTALVVLVGGGLILVTGSIAADDQITKGAIIGFIGIAINWVFSESTRTSTARQTTRALMTNTGPVTTTTATTDPASVQTTTTPATPPEEEETP